MDDYLENMNLPKVKPLEFIYELKCRRCNQFSNYKFGEDKQVENKPIDYAVKLFLTLMNSKVQNNQVEYCSNCDKTTVQDVVSYDPARNPY